MPAHVCAQRVPIGSRGRAFEDDAPFAHHDDAVGQVQQFVQIFADQQHRRAAVARGHQAAVDFGHRGEVQAEHRVADQQQVSLFGQFASEHRALHIAARK